jgi:hypothetical protein
MVDEVADDVDEFEDETNKSTEAELEEVGENGGGGQEEEGNGLGERLEGVEEGVKVVIELKEGLDGQNLDGEVLMRLQSGTRGRG